MNRFYSWWKNTCEEASKLAGGAGLRHSKRPQLLSIGKSMNLSSLWDPGRNIKWNLGQGTDPKEGCGVMLVLRSLGIQYRWSERSLPEEVKEVASYKRRALRPWLSQGIHAQRVIRRRKFWRWVSCDSRSNRESYHEGRRPAVRLSKEFHSPALGPDPCFIGMHDTRLHMAARSGAVRERRWE